MVRRQWQLDDRGGLHQFGRHRRPIAPVDCKTLAAQIADLNGDLSGETDINERKKTLQELGKLRSKFKQLGCHL